LGDAAKAFCQIELPDKRRAAFTFGHQQSDYCSLEKILLIDVKVPVATFLLAAMAWQLSPLLAVYIFPDKHSLVPDVVATIGVEIFATGGCTSVGNETPHDKF
jgi:hypothetical protein